MNDKKDLPRAWSFEEKIIAFWQKVDRSSGPDACWNWTGAVTAKWNYGCFAIAEGVTRGAHKLAWLLTNGETNGLYVMHTCDNRLCCNPAHMTLGTHQDNMDDMLAKGRKVTKVTADQVREIRAAYAPFGNRNAPKGFSKLMTEKYGISYRQIWTIATGKQWAHIK